MEILHYLAMTAGEIEKNPPLPGKIAYLSCHFSLRDPGLGNLPAGLPPGQMMILDDAVPMDGHDPDRVLEQLGRCLEANRCEALLLDFQRPPSRETLALAKLLAGELAYPVGVAEDYARELRCPVFLRPMPPDILPEAYFAPWRGREIWLDGGMEAKQIKVTEKGAEEAPLHQWDPEEGGFFDPGLCCHYRMALEGEAAVFTLFRTEEDVAALGHRCGELGVKKMVSLWQELAGKCR